MPPPKRDLVWRRVTVEEFAAMIRRRLEQVCPVYRPDHNGECLNCDEWADAHTPDAIEKGKAHQ